MIVVIGIPMETTIGRGIHLLRYLGTGYNYCIISDILFIANETFFTRQKNSYIRFYNALWLFDHSMVQIIGS